jgi:hypothetical protein
MIRQEDSTATRRRTLQGSFQAQASAWAACLDRHRASPRSVSPCAAPTMWSSRSSSSGRRLRKAAPIASPKGPEQRSKCRTVRLRHARTTSETPASHESPSSSRLVMHLKSYTDSSEQLLKHCRGFWQCKHVSTG